MEVLYKLAYFLEGVFNALERGTDPIYQSGRPLTLSGEVARAVSMIIPVWLLLRWFNRGIRRTGGYEADSLFIAIILTLIILFLILAGIIVPTLN